MTARVNTPPFHGTPDNINISAPRSNSNAFRKTLLLASHIRNEAHVEGVIRLAGNRNNVSTLSALDDNALLDALNNPTYSVHDKVDLLKKHLREAPILSPTQVDYLAKNIDHMDHAAIANYLKENLSERDFLRLQKLVELFKDVVKAPTSQMTLSNISIVISPTLLLPTVGSDAGLAAYDRLSGTQLCQIGDPRDAVVAVRRISDNQKIMEALFRYL